VTAMTKHEREDLQRLVRQREKVLKSAAKQRSAELIADFENQMGQEFSFDQDEVWERATKIAQEALAKANEQIAAAHLRRGHGRGRAAPRRATRLAQRVTPAPLQGAAEGVT